MFSRLFLSEKDVEAIQGALMRNPLLASLLMVSPVDAFRYMNLVPRFFDALLPPPPEDAGLVSDLLRALEEGRTALARPQPVEQEVAEPAPPELPRDRADEPPDVSLSVSKTVLQHALRLYAGGNFTGREFVFPVQRWLDVKTKGVSIELGLDHERAQITARLWGSFAFRAAHAPLDRLPGRLAFPIEIALRARLAVDHAGQLFLSVSGGDLSIVNPPLPERMARELVDKIAGEMPSIPLAQVPTRFEIPGDPPAELALRLTRIGIDPDGLRLELHL